MSRGQVRRTVKGDDVAYKMGVGKSRSEGPRSLDGRDGTQGVDDREGNTKT